MLRARQRCRRELGAARVNALLLYVVLAGCGAEAPRFVSVLVPADTSDTFGPYRVEAYVESADPVQRVMARLVGDEGFAELNGVRHSASSPELWEIDLPGLPVSTICSFYLVAVDDDGNKGVFPKNAPSELVQFQIISASE